MKKKELFQMLSVVEQVANLKGSVKFAYAVAKNRKCLQGEVETLKELIKPSKEIEEFETKRVKLCQDMSEKDENGAPVIKGNVFVMADPPAFEAKFKELQEEYKVNLEEHAQKKQDFDTLLEEPSDIEFFKVKLENFPNEISAVQMEWLMNLVEE